MRLLPISILILFISAIQAIADTRTDSPWDNGDFYGTPEEILAAAGKVPVNEEYGVQILLEECRFVLDEESRINFTYRLIYRIDSPGAVSSWSRVGRSWHPWYQDRPDIRARVITKEGMEYELDPANLGEYSDAEDGPDIYRDTKTLRGPLPAVEVGAVIEEIHQVQDLKPQFSSGIINSFTIGNSVPTQKTRITIDVHSNIPLKYILHHFPDIEPVRTESEDRIKLQFAIGVLEPWDKDTQYAPNNIARRPILRFSTGPSWNSIASSYSDIVDDRISASSIREISDQIVEQNENRDQIINGILTYLRKNVRYTGVEFGERSYIPSEPSVTLDRRFGDCKDKATLLVAFLRQSGIEAYVALLNTGPGHDLDPELPGMGLFDHVIVYVPSEPDLWIDPTNPYARLGELPDSNQGRLALIASDSTTGLIQTPSSTSSQNVHSEIREVFLAIEGGGRIVETTDVSGAFEREYRSSFSRKTVTETREQLEAYLKSRFQAEKLKSMDISDPENMSQPMRLELEGTGCRQIWTDPTEASTPIRTGDLVSRLPDILKPDKSDDEKNKEEKEKERIYPVLLQTPYIMEIQYRVHPPPGYALTSMPDNEERFFGPAVMTQEYEVNEDSVVTAMLRFDTVKALYSIEEAAAVKSEIARFLKEKRPKVIFQQSGESHLEAGRIPEALKEFQKLVERFPDEALYRTQVARAYLAAGLGSNARREAKKAVELNPESLIAQRILGVILTHDELGRKFMPGFDYTGAENALRKARQIDPDDFITRGELAILLEHDTTGKRYSPESRLDEAISEYEALDSELKNKGLASNLMLVFFHKGRFGELRSLWKDTPRNSYRDALYLAVTAVVDGIEEAIREASRIASQADTYRSILNTAGNLLKSKRYYPEAAALLTAGAKGDADSVSRLTLADFVRNIQKHEIGEVTATEPQGLICKFLNELTKKEKAELNDFKHFLIQPLFESADEEILSRQIQEMRDSIVWIMNQQGLSADQILDVLLSSDYISVAGDPETGYRARLQFSRILAGNIPPINFYILRIGEEYRLVGFGGTIAMIGKQLIQWIDKGELERTVQWLDWLTEDTYREGNEDILRRIPLQWCWTVGSKGSEEQMRLAAASLMVDGTYGELPVRIIEERIDSLVESGLETGLNATLVLAGHSTEHYVTMLKAADKLLQIHPRSSSAFFMKMIAMLNLKRYDDVEKETERRLDRLPGETETATLHAEISRYKEDFDEHRRRLIALIRSGKGTVGEYNNLAWLDIMENCVTPDTLQYIQQAVAMTNNSDATCLHTLATVYAELGNVTEAHDVLLALLRNRSDKELESPDWYVLGRIAEHYGASDAAIEAYRKVEPPEEKEVMSSSTYSIAARRLQSLVGNTVQENRPLQEDPLND
ncbi:MAG: DUF3857 domain-containing protein [Acidobacteria bacterium]|nr:DUF3857 domain-containing protein [Acidobacteriota bacterium]